MLDLIHPMYRETASYGHFGRAPVEMEYDWQDDARGEAPPGPFTAFSWERTDRAEALGRLQASESS